METAPSNKGHDERGAHDRRCRKEGISPGVGNPGKKSPESIASFGIGQKPSEDGLPLLLFKSGPGGSGDLIQEIEDLMVSIHQEPGGSLLILGDVKLFGFPVGAAGEDERRVLLAPLALAVGLAARDLTKIGGGVEELFAGDERLQARATLAFNTGHAGRSHGHLQSYIPI
jgi:hypothetical protein